MGVKLALLHISGADISSDQLWIPPYPRCCRYLRQAWPCENRATGQAQSRLGREDQGKSLREEAEYAVTLNDLRVPPSNRLEALRGGQKGRHSIRINDQWRICFDWDEGEANNVEIIDYH